MAAGAGFSTDIQYAFNPEEQIDRSELQTFSMDRYFHALVLRKKSRFFWTKKEELNQKATQILRETQVDGRTRPFGKYGWTPLHLAVILENHPAISYFMQRCVQIKDRLGLIALDYAITLKRDACLQAFPLIPMAPFEETRVVQECFFSDTPRRPIPLRDRHFHMPDDFEKGVTRLLATKRNIIHQEGFKKFNEEEVRFLHIIHNLHEVAKQIGIVIVETDRQYTPRDHFVHMQNRVMSTIADCKGITDDIEPRSLSFMQYYNKVPIALGYRKVFAGHMGVGYEKRDHPRSEQKKFFGNERRDSIALYLEKGNAFHFRNSRGEGSVLLGEEEFAYMMICGRKNKIFEQDEFLRIDRRIQSDDELFSLAEEMYALGCLKLNEKTGVITDEMRSLLFQDLIDMPLREGETFKGRAIHLLLLQPFNPSTAQLEASRKMIEKYKMQKIALQYLLQTIFELRVENIVYVPQMLAHIDLMMMPGPSSHIFAMDFEASLKALKTIKRNIELFHLTENDCTLLEKSIAKTEEFIRVYNPFIKNVHSILRRAHFHVIETPGFFSDNDQFSINFLNAATGISSQTSMPYMITFGANMGDHLGEALMNIYGNFIKWYIPQVQLYFIGRNPLDPTDFSESMGWHKNGLGVHCMTFEMDRQRDLREGLLRLMQRGRD